MEKVIKKIVEELNASSGAIMVRSPEDDNLLICGASYNMPKAWDDLVNRVEDNPKNLNGTVAFTGKPKIANSLNIIFHGQPVGSVIVVPVMRLNKHVVNIEIMHYSYDQVFSDEDLKYLQREAEKLADKIA